MFVKSLSKRKIQALNAVKVAEERGGPKLGIDYELEVERGRERER